MLSFEPIAEHDSWLALDLVWGCPNNCGYCYLRRSNLVAMFPQKKFPLDETLRETLRAVLHDCPSDIPVSVGNTTDMLINEDNFQMFCKLAQTVGSIDPDRSIVVITKARISKERAERIADATNGRGIVILSQSFSKEYDSEVEKGNVSAPEDTYQSLENIAKVEGLKSIHFWRPFLIRWNSDEDISVRIRRLKECGCMASVVIGLKGNAQMLGSYSDNLRDWAAPELVSNRRFGDERVSEERIAVLLSSAKAMEYPLFRQTSCALAFMQGTPDINGTSKSKIRESHCKNVSCPSIQRSVCGQDPLFKMDRVQIRALLDRYAGRHRVQVSDEVYVQDEIDEYIYNHLYHVLHRKPNVEKIHFKKVWQGNISDDSEE